MGVRSTSSAYPLLLCVCNGAKVNILDDTSLPPRVNLGFLQVKEEVPCTGCYTTDHPRIATRAVPNTRSNEMYARVEMHAPDHKGWSRHCASTLFPTGPL